MHALKHFLIELNIPDVQLWYTLHSCLNASEPQLWWILPASHMLAEVIPKVFDQRKIRWFSWPLHRVDVVLLNVLFANSCCLGCCIVVLKPSNVWMSQHGWVDHLGQNINTVLLWMQIFSSAESQRQRLCYTQFLHHPSAYRCSCRRRKLFVQTLSPLKFMDRLASNLMRHSGVSFYQRYGNYHFWSVIIDILDIRTDQISLSVSMVTLQL